MKKANKTTIAIMDYLEKQGCKKDYKQVPADRICDNLGIAKSTALKHLRFLMANGYLSAKNIRTVSQHACRLYLILRDLNDIKKEQLKVNDVTFTGTKCINPKDVFNIVKNYVTTEFQEHFIIISLDNKSRVIKSKLKYIGTSDEITISPREIFRDLIEDRAHATIIAHNHPSGDITPSSQDINTTERMVDIGHLMNIHVLDHLVFSKDDYSSMKQERPNTFRRG